MRTPLQGAAEPVKIMQSDLPPVRTQNILCMVPASFSDRSFNLVILADSTISFVSQIPATAHLHIPAVLRKFWTVDL